MKIVIAGATGFIGKALCNLLAEQHQIIALTRNSQKAAAILPQKTQILTWDGKSLENQKEKIQSCDAIINLSGTNIATGRWTKKQKEKIVNSRLNSTKALIKFAKNMHHKPEVMMLASAIGYYKSQTDQRLNENSPAGQTFLSNVCQQVENLAKEITHIGIRSIVIRTSIVLDPSGGALEKMILPFKFFLGSKFGNGQQWMPWISLTDEVSAIKFLIENKNLSGVFNLSTKQPIQNKDFAKTLAKILHRPCIITLPQIALKILFGQKAKEIFLANQKVYPDRLLEAGFKFKYPDLKSAFESMNFGRIKK